MVCKTLFIPRSYDMAVAAVVGAVGAAGVYVANKSANEQKRAQDRALQEQRAANEQARETAQAEAERADIEYNRAVQKQPEVEAIVSRSEQAAKAGPAATVLTNNRKQMQVLEDSKQKEWVVVVY